MASSDRPSNQVSSIWMAVDLAAEPLLEGARQIGRLGDNGIGFQHVVRDQPTHFRPAVFTRHRDEIRQIDVPTVHFEHFFVFRGRGVERHTFLQSLTDPFEAFVVGGTADEAVASEIEILQRAPGLLSADFQIGQHHLGMPFVGDSDPPAGVRRPVRRSADTSAG